MSLGLNVNLGPSIINDFASYPPGPGILALFSIVDLSAFPNLNIFYMLFPRKLKCWGLYVPGPGDLFNESSDPLIPLPTEYLGDS